MNIVDSDFLKEFLEMGTVNPKTYLLQKIFTDILPNLTRQDKQIIGYYLRYIEEANQKAIAVDKLINSKDYLSVILPTDELATCEVGERINKDVLRQFEDKLSPYLKTRRNHGLFLMALYNSKIKCTDIKGKEYKLNYASLSESVKNHELKCLLLKYSKTNNILTKNIWSGTNLSFSDESWCPERVLHDSLFNRTEIIKNTNLRICSFKQKNVTLKWGNLALSSLTNKSRDQSCKKLSFIFCRIVTYYALPFLSLTTLILGANLFLTPIGYEFVNDSKLKNPFLPGAYLTALVIFGQMYLMRRQYLYRKTEVSKLPFLLKDDGRFTDKALLKVTNVLNHNICPEYSGEDMLAYICLLTLYIKAQNQSQSLESFLGDNSIPYEQYCGNLDVDRLLSQDTELQFVVHIAHVLNEYNKNTMREKITQSENLNLDDGFVQFELSQKNYHIGIRNNQILLWPFHLANGNLHQSQTQMFETLMKFEQTSLITNFNQKHQRDINSCQNALNAEFLNILITPSYKKRIQSNNLNLQTSNHPNVNGIQIDANNNLSGEEEFKEGNCLYRKNSLNKSKTVAIQPLFDKRDIENQISLYNDHQFEDFQKNGNNSGRMFINVENSTLHINDIEMQRFR